MIKLIFPFCGLIVSCVSGAEGLVEATGVEPEHVLVHGERKRVERA